MMDPIIKDDATRILTPTEYESLRSAMEIPYYPIICDALLLSGMRPIEFKRFEPEWYKASRRIVKLPDGACLKQKCEFVGRSIMLSLPGCDAFDRLISTKYMFKGKLVPVLDMRPQKVSFNDTLKRYAIKANLPEATIIRRDGTTYTGPDAGITVKGFRKTLVSWLVACFPEKAMYIRSSMGHTEETIIDNYLGLGFTTEEIATMKSKYLYGWGEAV
jgi:integrase